MAASIHVGTVKWQEAFNLAKPFGLGNKWAMQQSSIIGVSNMTRVLTTLQRGSIGQRAAIITATVLSIITGAGLGFLVHVVHMVGRAIQIRRGDKTYELEEEGTALIEVQYDSSISERGPEPTGYGSPA